MSIANITPERQHNYGQKGGRAYDVEEGDYHYVQHQWTRQGNYYEGGWWSNEMKRGTYVKRFLEASLTVVKCGLDEFDKCIGYMPDLPYGTSPGQDMKAGTYPRRHAQIIQFYAKEEHRLNLCKNNKEIKPGDHLTLAGDSTCLDKSDTPTKLEAIERAKANSGAQIRVQVIK